MGIFWRKPVRETNEDDMAKLLKTTTLTTFQINHLYRRFLLYCGSRKPPNYIVKTDFLASASLQPNPLFALILREMFGNKKRIDFVEFATFLSIFKASNLQATKEMLAIAKQKKLRLIFRMYDADRDGRIGQMDLINVIYKLFHDYMGNRRIVQVANIMMIEMDKSGNNQILFDDFCKAFEIFDMEEVLVVRIPN